MNKTCIKCSEIKAVEMFKSIGSNICNRCNAARIKAWGKANPEKMKAKYARHNKTEKRKAYLALYAQTEKRKAYIAAYQVTEKRKAYQAAYNKLYNYVYKIENTQRSASWKKANKGRVNTTNAAYLKRIKQATPPWADQQAILDVYLEAEYFGMEVDHIVPIRSKLVCGLHTWENLQLLTKLENITKGNRVWPDMPTCEPRKDGI